MSDASDMSGAVRIRSNVTLNSGGRSLIPGDVLRHYGMSTYEVTERQREELMYYVPCCICGRRIMQIHEEGCDQTECRRQGVPSRAEAQRLLGDSASGD